MEPGSVGLYNDASVYDILHAPGTREEVDGLLRMHGRFVTAKASAKLWLEPACGTGRYLIRLAKKSVRGVGFDVDPGMVEYATARAKRLRLAPRPRFGVATMESFVDEGLVRPGSVRLAFNLINTVRHLMSDEAMLAHFGQMRAALAPGGVYLVGISLTVYGLEPPSEDVWEGRRGRTTVRQVVNFVPPVASAGRARRTERIFSHLTISKPSGEEDRDSTYTLRTYDEVQWRQLVKRAGWRVLGVVDEEGDDVTLTPPGYGIFVLSPE